MGFFLELRGRAVQAQCWIALDLIEGRLGNERKIMSILLSVLGLAMIYWSCRVIARIDEPKVNRTFKSWFSEKLNKEEAAGYRVVNGVLIAIVILFFGLFMVVLGIIGLFT